MLNVDDAMRFLLEWALYPQAGEYSSYGYEIYLPIVIHVYRKTVLEVGEPGFLGQGREAEELSPVFYDAAWEMCRRGILRPGVRSLGKQATADGSSGNGFSLTAAPRSNEKKRRER